MRLSVTMSRSSPDLRSMTRPPQDRPAQHGDGDRLHEHPQAHQLVRIGTAEIAAAEQGVDAEGQDGGDREQGGGNQEAEDIHRPILFQDGVADYGRARYAPPPNSW